MATATKSKPVQLTIDKEFESLTKDLAPGTYVRTGNRVSFVWVAADRSMPEYRHFAVIEGRIATGSKAATAKSRAASLIKSLIGHDAELREFQKMGPESPVGSNPYTDEVVGGPRSYRRGGTIYFIQEANFGNIKIGWAVDAEQRMALFQTGNSTPLKLVGAIPGTDRKDEAELHRRFRAFRARGEWFYPCRRLVRFIKSEAAL